MQSKLKQITVIVIATTLVIGGVIIAGSLTPSGNTSTPTFYTLEDIYQKLNLNTYSASTHSVSTTSSPTGTMHTLSDIWDKIPTITASTVATGTTILGIPGTARIITGASETPDLAENGVGRIENSNGLVEFWNSVGTRWVINLDFPATSDVLSSTTVNGQSGTYSPESCYPLSGASETADLAEDGVGHIENGNVAVEWWKSDGTRQFLTLDLPATSDVLSTATVNGSAGTIAVQASDISSTAQTASEGVNKFTVPTGYYAGAVKVTATDAEVAALDTDIFSDNIKDNVTIFGVEGNYASAPITVWATAPGTYTWSDAVAYCLTLGTGWRIPTFIELSDLFNAGVPTMTMPTDFVLDRYYLSGTENTGVYMTCPGVCEYFQFNTFEDTDPHYVRCIHP